MYTSSDKVRISLNLPDIADKRPEPKRAVLLGIPAKLKKYLIHLYYHSHDGIVPLLKSRMYLNL